MRHVMIDCETLGTAPGSVILSIGAIRWDIWSGAIQEKFYYKIDPEWYDSKLGEMFTVSPSTVKWWMEQSDAARTEAFSGEGSLDAGLEGLTRFCYGDAWLSETEKDFRCWSHGLLADVAWLNEAYSLLGMSTPWTYKEVRDTRTAYEMANVNPRDFFDSSLVQHHPVHDCIAQAAALTEAYSILKGQKEES